MPSTFVLKLYELVMKVMKFMVFAIMLSFISSEVRSQDYPYLGQVTYLINSVGDTIDSGTLLKDDFLAPQQIDVFTIRYESDTLATRASGEVIEVNRQFDVYIPRDDLYLVSNGELLDELPVMVLLHAGSSNRELAAEYAYKWASRGFIVMAPTYRSDRLGVNYCQAYSKTLYYSAQDVSAAVRTFTYYLDDSLLPVPTISNNPLVDKPIDPDTFFAVGRSYGGSAVFHSFSRQVQAQWEDFLGAEDYFIAGVQGAVNLGGNEGLHETGSSLIDGYPMPYERFKAIMCRTASIERIDQVQYELTPHKLPTLVFIGTCDKLVPYDSSQVIGTDDFCIADVFFSDGTSQNSHTSYGPQVISNLMAEANIYNELITFCGGGHESNNCVKDIIEGHNYDFIERVLMDDYQDGEVLESVYRYGFENYSNQCCQIGDDYAYLEKCSCTDDNPYEVIDLEFIIDEECQFQNNCDLDPICDLLPLSDDLISEWFGNEIELISEDNKLSLKLESLVHQNLSVTFRDYTGRVLETHVYQIKAGINIFPMPRTLPQNQILFADVPGFRPVKFFINE